MTCQKCNIRKLMEEARQLYEAGESLSAWKLLENEPIWPQTQPGPSLFKAKVAMECGQWPEALELIEGLLSLEEPKPCLMLAYADCLISVGRIQEARMVLSSLENGGGHRFVQHILQARIAARLGWSDQVYDAMETAIGFNKKGAVALALRCPELAPMALGAFTGGLMRAVSA